uniref:IC97/Casc1 N-terminal domain-containing protein n=1 Tax=Bicosoecida sp. CB-2014 TaxID=1486930 RepID=A0A7S1G676_9STRA
MEAERVEWEKTLACSTKPDPSDDAAINTYVTEQMETSEPRLEKAGKIVDHTAQIVNDLNVELARVRGLHDYVRVGRLLDFRRRLYDVVTKKLDEATANVLTYSSEYMEDPLAGELMVQHKFGDTSYAIWVNKGGRALRMKSLPFTEVGLQVDVPKPIATQNVAIRTIWHEFDHAKDRAESVAALEAYLRSIGALAEVDATSAKGGKGGKGGKGAAESKDESKGSEESKAKAASEAKGEGEGGEGGDGEADVPADPDAGTSVGTSRDVPLGGVMYVEMLRLPPGSKQVLTWTLQQVTAETKTVTRLPHPMKDQVGAAAAAQALKIRFTMPKHVIMPSAPEGDDGVDDAKDAEEKPADAPGPPIRVAHWDAAAGVWSEEGITEAEYAPDSRLVTFHTSRLTAMAVVQPRHMHLPFFSWQLVPSSPEETVLSIESQRFTVSIEITPAKVRLLEPAIPELEEMLGVPMLPAQLLQALARSGLVIDPIDEDAKYVTSSFTGSNMVPKERAFERQLYLDAASLAPAFALRSSKWNQQQGARAAVLYAKESLDYDEDPDEGDETDWRCALFEIDEEAVDGIRVSLVKAMESDEEYNGGRAEMEVTHRRLGRAIATRATPEAMEVASEASPLFQRTVAETLSLVRPLSFH